MFAARRAMYLSEAKIWPPARASAMSLHMNERRYSAAGGIFLFLGPVIGAIIGVGRGQPILWMLGGFAIGVAVALLIWLVQRRR